MKMGGCWILIGLLLPLAVAASTAAPKDNFSLLQFLEERAQPAEEPKLPPREVRFREMLGDNVEDRNGDSLGQVRDLWIDLHSGAVKEVLVHSGGFLGFGGEHRFAPGDQLILGTVIRNLVALDTTREHWLELAPVTSITPTSPDLISAKGLLDRRVVDAQHEELARVSNLLLVKERETKAFLVLQPSEAMAKTVAGAPNSRFAVPFSTWRRNSTGDDQPLVLDLSVKDFQQASPFQAQRAIMTGAAEAVYRYLPPPPDNSRPVAADNTGVNARDRGLPAVTPFDQAEDPRDLSLALRIRRTLVNDPQLSLRAKNIKIVAWKGRIWLRGPVRSQREKLKIGLLAQQSAPSAPVLNQLDFTH